MSDKVKNVVITIMFVSVLVITMIVNIAKKDGTISISERRKLEQFPSFSIYKLFNGKFFEKFDKYTTDQFTYRDNLRKLKVETELNIFKKKDYNNLYEYNGYIINQEYPLNEKSIENLSNKVKQIANQYLTENNNVYFTIVPDKNYFVDKDNLKLDYNKMENMLEKSLTFAEYIKINDLLELSDYYKTDTQVGIELEFVSDETFGSNTPYSLKIIIPCNQCSDASANMTGADSTKQTMNFEAVDNLTDELITVELVNNKTEAY